MTLMITLVSCDSIDRTFSNAEFRGCAPHNSDKFNANLYVTFGNELTASQIINPSTLEISAGSLDDGDYICPGQIRQQLTNERSEYDFVGKGYGSYFLSCLDFPLQSGPTPGNYSYENSANLNKEYDGGLYCNPEDPCSDVEVGYQTVCSGAPMHAQPFVLTAYNGFSEESVGYTTIVMAGQLTRGDNGNVYNTELSNVMDSTFSIVDWSAPSELGDHNLNIYIEKIIFEAAAYYECNSCPAPPCEKELQYFNYQPDQNIELFSGEVHVVNLIANGSIVNIQANGNPIDPTSGIPVNPDGTPTHITITVSNDGASNTEQNLAMPITVENVVVTSNPSDCFIFTPTTPLPSSAIPVGDTINIEGDLSANPTPTHNCNDANISFNISYEGISEDCNGATPEGNDVWTYNRSKAPDYTCSINDVVGNYGDPITINITTSNIGGGPGGNPSNTYIRILPSGYEEPFNIPSLNAVQSISNYRMITCNYSTPQTIYGYADVNDNISESDENNNQCNATITCTSYPDYVAKCTGGTGYLGDVVQYTVETKNVGQPATNHSITNVSIEGFIINQYPVPGLNTNDIAQESFNFTCMIAGQYNITPYADALFNISELDETNNYEHSCIINCLSNYTCIDYV